MNFPGLASENNAKSRSARHFFETVMNFAGDRGGGYTLPLGKKSGSWAGHSRGLGNFCRSLSEAKEIELSVIARRLELRERPEFRKKIATAFPPSQAGFQHPRPCAVRALGISHHSSLRPPILTFLEKYFRKWDIILDHLKTHT